MPKITQVWYLMQYVIDSLSFGDTALMLDV